MNTDWFCVGVGVHLRTIFLFQCVARCRGRLYPQLKTPVTEPIKFFLWHVPGGKNQTEISLILAQYLLSRSVVPPGGPAQFHIVR